MPQVLEHIDAIARKKGRDILYIDFPLNGDWYPPEMNWDAWPPRQQVVAWPKQNQIAWCPYGDFADEDSMMDGYFGRIYVDVPFEIKDPVYQRLQAYLEAPTGTLKLPGVLFSYLPLEMAMKNAHHDEPGFWERGAKDL